MPVRLCIFDLDGVIVDTAKYHYMAWKRLAREIFRKDFSIEHNERLKGISRLESLDILLEIIGSEIPEEQKYELAEKKNIWYVEYIMQITKDEILPGFMNFLVDVKKSGLKTGIGSASKNTRIILEKLELMNMFDSVVDGTKITYAKPNPEVFLKCAEELGIETQHCVVFEDAVAGIDAAISAGMLAIGIGDKKILGKAHLVIPSFENLTVSDVLKLSEI